MEKASVKGSFGEDSNVQLSIVSTLYASESTIEAFVKRATIAAHSLVGEDYEIVLVHDGSPDQSLEITIRLIEQGARVKVVDLSRNFGHHQALLAGMSFSSGEYVFLLDSDLEESPEWVSDFWATLTSSGYDAVYGVQSRRKGRIFERASGAVFYSIFNRMSQVPIPQDITTARLMTRRYVDSLLKFDESGVFLGGLFALTGYQQASVDVVKGSSSPSTYSLSKRFELAMDAITSFSVEPLVLLFKAGLVIFLGAATFVGYLIISWLFMGSSVSGWTSTLASIWLLGGLNVLFLGLVGIYVSKTYLESKNRPNYIVREVWPKTDLPRVKDDKH
jgi:putative glycosyltransferase